MLLEKLEHLLYRVRNALVDVLIRYHERWLPEEILRPRMQTPDWPPERYGPEDFGLLRELEALWRIKKLWLTPQQFEASAKKVPECRGLLSEEGPVYMIEFFFPCGTVFLHFTPNESGRSVHWSTTMDATIDEVGDVMDGLVEVLFEHLKIEKNAAE